MTDRRAMGLGRLRGANNEGVLLLIIVLFVLMIGLVDPGFLSIKTAFDVAQNSLVDVVFALGLLIVIISGGIDVSFPVIGIFAGYTVVKVLTDSGGDPGVWVAFGFAALIGALLGLVNGAVIAGFRLPTLIVTLGTMGIFRGVLLVAIGTTYIGTLPGSLSDLGKANVATVESGGITTPLSMLIIPVIVLCVLVHLLLTRTMFGRGVFAIGGDEESARRVGVPVVRTQLVIYIVVGVLAATAGLMYVSIGLSAKPQDLAGHELDIIAAVVLGGASIFGGRGSVFGTVLGVIVINLISNSLVALGVSGTWQRAAVGALLVIGVGAQALSARRRTSAPGDPSLIAEAGGAS